MLHIGLSHLRRILDKRWLLHLLRMLVSQNFKGTLVSLLLFVLEAFAWVWVTSKLDELILNRFELDFHDLERLVLSELRHEHYICDWVRWVHVLTDEKLANCSQVVSQCIFNLCVDCGGRGGCFWGRWWSRACWCRRICLRVSDS